MKAERDIAGIALPFIAGVAVSVYAGTIYPWQAVLSCIAVAALTSILMPPSGKALGSPLQWAVIIALMAFCGHLTGLTDRFLSLSRTDGAGWFEQKALDMCMRMESAIDAIPFEREATGQIIKALLTGERSGIPKEVTAAFRESGASHILALSGLHLGIIYGIVRGLLSLLGNSATVKKIRSLLVIGICGFYTLATGAGASIVRAFLFIVIGEYASIRHIRLTLPVILMTAMSIQVFFSPDSIRDVGFQLSYAAIAGIAFIFPWLQGFWPGERRKDDVLTKGARWMWDSAAMSISCQITTGPIAYYYFRSFPMHFILTNMIAIPLTSIIIPAALLTLASSCLGWHPTMLLRATEWLVTALSEALGIIAEM